MKVSKTKRELVPEGRHSGVLVDVVDLGSKQTKYGEKEQVSLIWQVDVLGKDGKRLTIGRIYTKSINEGAALGQAITQWIGLRDDEVELDHLIGTACELVVSHTQREGKVYDNVMNVFPFPRDGMPLKPNGYVRKAVPDFGSDAGRAAAERLLASVDAGRAA